MSHSPHSSGDDPAQLDLFTPPSTNTSQCARIGMSAEIARAQVSPGWWILVASLFSRAAGGDLAVTECREVDGELRLRLVALASDGTIDPTVDLTSHAEAIAVRAAGICGACGRVAGRQWRRHGDAPIRVVCSECQEQLEAGMDFLEVADRHYRLDGTRRAQALIRASRGRDISRAATGRALGAMLPTPELRDLIMKLRSRMGETIVGQDDVVARLALLGALHVGGGLARGARVLLLGRSGTGKSSSIVALRDALEAEDWRPPFASIDAVMLQSPGWSGAPSIGQVIEHALGREDPASTWAQHAVVVIDEIHHVGLVPGLHGNMQAKRSEVIASLLSVVGGGVTRLGEGATGWSSQRALVIGAGAFTGLLSLDRRPPTTNDLVTAGLPLELATRFQEILVLQPLPEPALVELLERWPALVHLKELCTRVGFTVHIHPETVRRAARAVTLGHDGSTPRTAGSWLVTALRDALLGALDDPDATTIELSPDSLPIPSTATLPRPEPPSDDDGEWDTTIVLTRR
jgi:hypothetical protein